MEVELYEAPNEVTAAHERVEVLGELSRALADMGEAQARALAALAAIDREGHWDDGAARDMPHWVSMNVGISGYKARRWIAAGHALEALPTTRRHLVEGRLPVDKVVELTRFATPDDEASLARWARRVSTTCVRQKADVASKPNLDDVREADRDRYCAWSYTDSGTRFDLHASMPAADGALLAKAIHRAAAKVPVPDDDTRWPAEARQADGLLALAMARLGEDPDADRATVVVHADLDSLSGGSHCVTEDGGVLHPEVAARLMCSGRIQSIIEDAITGPISFSPLDRDPGPALMRYLKQRDMCCTFPGCGARRFLQAHHIVWRSDGGPTVAGNLTLLCFFHHKRVHDYGWRVFRLPSGQLEWLRPNGVNYRAGPIAMAG